MRGFVVARDDDGEDELPQHSRGMLGVPGGLLDHQRVMKSKSASTFDYASACLRLVVDLSFKIEVLRATQFITPVVSESFRQCHHMHLS